MPRRVSREEFIRVASAPKARFHSLTINSAGAARLGERVPAPSYWFERHQEVVEEDGSYTVDSRHVAVHMLVDGKLSVLFYLDGARLQSCTFAFDLRSYELERAAVAMKAARLVRLVPAAASHALANMPKERLDAGIEASLRHLSATGRKSRKKS